jgi:hypothetical protein
MPVDHLIGFNKLMPDKLEMELIKRENIPLTTLGVEKMRPDLKDLCTIQDFLTVVNFVSFRRSH